MLELYEASKTPRVELLPNKAHREQLDPLAHAHNRSRGQRNR